MAIIAKASGGADFELTPAGTFAALCYQVIDIGTQTTEYKGDKKSAHKVIIGFELHGENLDDDGTAYMTDGKPFSIRQRMTVSLHEKAALRGFLESWRGVPFTEAEAQGFDVESVLGLPCMITVQHKRAENNKVYANISNIKRLMKTIEKPKMVNAPQLFSLSPWNQGAFEKISQGMREVIKQSKEYQEMFVKPQAEPEQVHDYTAEERNYEDETHG